MFQVGKQSVPNRETNCFKQQNTLFGGSEQLIQAVETVGRTDKATTLIGSIFWNKKKNDCCRWSICNRSATVSCTPSNSYLSGRYMQFGASCR